MAKFHDSDKIFFALLKSEKIPIPEIEYKFSKERKWRADYCWINEKIILEVEGGVWVNGRHTSSKGFLADIEKYNAAVCLGYKLIRVIPDKLLKIDTLNMIKQLLKPC
jgi:very-short-patch-repair endonuclease